jgi:uncharacterized protein with NRDE domain
MCLLVLAWNAHPRYRLVLAANRDEYHERPADALARWPQPDILAGRDRKAGGTWLGLDRARRFAVVTNFRELQRPRRSAPSRGRLIPEYLETPQTPESYLARLETDAPGYSGFNLLVGDHESLWYASNRMDRFAQALPAGVHGLSNEFLDSPWPKLQRVRRSFETWLGDETGIAAQDETLERLFSMLADRTPAPEGSPGTGLPADWERTLSSPFVTHPTYGTRCSTILLIEPSGALVMAERRFDPAGQVNGNTEVVLDAGDWPA